MKNLKFLALVLAGVIILTACDLKVNLNSDSQQNLNQVKDSKVSEDPKDETAQVFDYEVKTDDEFKVLSITRGEVTYEDFADFCGTEVMVYAQPANQPLIIFKPFDPGSDKPVNHLYVFNFDKVSCQELEISQELSDFGARVLSPDQTKMVLALETNEARELKLIDLVNDKAMSLITLDEGETLNGGYGALSNHFDIKWLDNKMVQYTVFKDTVNNYDLNAPEAIEKVLEVRVVNIE